MDPMTRGSEEKTYGHIRGEVGCTRLDAEKEAKRCLVEDRVIRPLNPVSKDTASRDANEKGTGERHTQEWWSE